MRVMLTRESSLNASLIPSSDCFALLDDSGGGDAPRSRLYTGFVRELRGDAESLSDTLEAMQAALNEGMHAVGVFSYELGAALQGIEPHPGDVPAIRILLFHRCEKLRADQAERWLAEQDASDAPAGIAGVQASIGREQFDAAIARIHAYIEAGDTYQVNFTYRLRFDAYGGALALYRRLRARQPVPYGAVIALPDGGALLSLSPELFVRHDVGNGSGVLTAQPMKGTAAVAGGPAEEQENAQRAAALAADEKNRAENLMIVDLLRNDLGRVAQTGSVQVPQLFQVERFGGVLQMTSTIRARLREDATLADIFAALYPCGSITGAPKRRTMQIIDELENAPRGVYTGAIGWFDTPAPCAAPSAAQRAGDFCLSVPIRTLVLQPPHEDGLRRGEMGVGAGIVHDSRAEQEYAECLLKARFLTGLDKEFELFETMHATREQGCRHLERHLRRLKTSAGYFGFAFDEARITSELEQACAELRPAKPYRLRLALHQDGRCAIRVAPLHPIAEPVKLLLAAQPAHALDIFLRHKTTVRAQYDQAWQDAEAQGAFDMLFFNTEGELTEGGRSNVLLKIDGRWVTPPLSCGLLPGVMRSVLLDDPEWNVQERMLTREDLRNAEEIAVCNALRGVMTAWLAEK